MVNASDCGSDIVGSIPTSRPIYKISFAGVV